MKNDAVTVLLLGAACLLAACGSKTGAHQVADGSAGQGGGAGATAPATGGSQGTGGTAAGGSVSTNATGGSPGAGGIAGGGSGGAGGGGGSRPGSGGTGVGPGGTVGAGGTGLPGSGGIRLGGVDGSAGGAGGVDAPIAALDGGGGTIGGAGGAGALDGSGAGGTVASHDRCANPQRVDFTDGHITISDDTSRGSDEFPTLVCGGPLFAGPLTGHQLYYRFTVRAGLKYELRQQLSGGDDPDIIYVFPASAACTAAAIQAACQSGGSIGTASLTPGALTSFVPSQAGDYIVAVDADWSGPGGPFTLDIFEYCGTASPTGCKPEACTPSTVGTCDKNLLTICADGTGLAVNDCAASGSTCFKGACQPTVMDIVGAVGRTPSPTTAGAAGATAVNFYSVATSRTLTEIDQLRYQGATIPLTWVVFESLTSAGPYAEIFSKATTSSAVASGAAESSGTISVALVAGRYYAIGVVLPAGGVYDVAQASSGPGLPEATFFGQLISAEQLDGPPAWPNLTYAAPGTFAFRQQLTTKL